MAAGFFAPGLEQHSALAMIRSQTTAHPHLEHRDDRLVRNMHMALYSLFS